nr:hypothetical protein [Leifsonia xyli]
MPWVPPSPNLPTRESAWAYPGTGLIEALDASEGRGTTVPFLWAGHSCLDEVAAVALADELNARELPGVLLRAMMTTPAAGKQSGLVCGGVQLHVTAPDAFDGLRTGLRLVQALAARPGVGWREETDLLPSGGGKAETVPWIDRLTGTADVRRSLAAGIAPETIAAGWGDGLATFRERAQPHRLYALPPLPSADRPARSGGGTIPG